MQEFAEFVRRAAGVDRSNAYQAPLAAEGLPGCTAPADLPATRHLQMGAPRQALARVPASATPRHLWLPSLISSGALAVRSVRSAVRSDKRANCSASDSSASARPRSVRSSASSATVNFPGLNTAHVKITREQKIRERTARVTQRPPVRHMPPPAVNPTAGA